MLAKANRERLAVLLSETEKGDAGSARYAAALRWTFESHCIRTDGPTLCVIVYCYACVALL